jgi:ribosomal protein S18 acetylase RimI-like enzyme
MEIVDYAPRHLDQVLEICRAEGWVTFASNRERAGRAMTGPGVTGLVAVEGAAEDGGAAEGGGAPEGGAANGGVASEDERVLGFAQTVGDGCFSGYLCMLLVRDEARGRGIGKALVERTLVDSGVLRLDLLSSERARSLYERFPHIEVPGFRLYPDESLLPPGARSS